MLEFDFNDLEKKLSQVTKKIGNEAVDRALESAADVTLNAMDLTVPVDTGELKQSLGIIKKSGSGTERKLKVGINSNKREIIERGYYQEHGTRRMVGRKWMKKAAENAKDEAMNTMIESLKESIKW